MLGEIISVEHAAARAQPRRVLRHVRRDGRRRPHGRVGPRRAQGRLQGSRSLDRRRLPALGRRAVAARCSADYDAVAQAAAACRRRRRSSPPPPTPSDAPLPGARGARRSIDAVLQSRLPAVPDRGVLPLRAGALGRAADGVGADLRDGAARRRRCSLLVAKDPDALWDPLGGALLAARDRRPARGRRAGVAGVRSRALGDRRARCCAARSRSAGARGGVDRLGRAASAWIARGIVGGARRDRRDRRDRVAGRPRSTTSPRVIVAHGHLLVLAVLGVGIGATREPDAPAARPRGRAVRRVVRCSTTRGRRRCRGRIATCSRCCSARSSSITTSGSGSSAAEAPARRKALVIVSLCSNLGILVFFKYADFFSARRAPPRRRPAPPDPAGRASRFTPSSRCRTRSTSIAGSCRRPARWSQFATFVLFFPQLVAGPIVRAQDLLPQLAELPALELEAATAGPVPHRGRAVQEDRARRHPRAGAGRPRVRRPRALLGDRGARRRLRLRAADLPRLLGVLRHRDRLGRRSSASTCRRTSARRTAAANLQEFWRRWHISLSTWLRDYLYITLGGSQRRAVADLPEPDR